MRITGLRTQIVVVPYDPPIRLGGLVLQSAGYLLVFVESDQGEIGEGLVYSHNGRRIGLLREMAQSFEPLIVGLDPHDAGVFSARAWADLRHFGAEGISVLGLSGVTSALCDLRAKLLGVNVAEMLGACRTRIACYQSDELWADLTLDELQRSAARQVEAGFCGLKMRLSGNLREDVARVGAVREAVGPDIALMADANQRLTVSEAIRLGRELEAFNLAWFEEPVAADDHRGEAEIAAALDTPLASGESVYGSRGVMEMLRLGACDIVSLDLPRMGGPPEFVKAAALADAHNVPVTNHMYHEMSLSLMAAIPNAGLLEHLPLTSPIYRERLELDANGQALLPQRPGWGFSFDREVIERYAAG